MRKKVIQLISVLLILAMLPVTAFAEPNPADSPVRPEKPGTSETGRTPQGSGSFEYPDDWSRKPLMFAVENGILKGDNHGKLNPSSNITRAEMAAILTRLLGAAEKSSLKAYTDVDPNAWYCEELAAAVAAGLFNGMSANTMAPNSPITREQALVVLSRTFGVVTEQHNLWQRFSDGSRISPYARDAVSAMSAAGACRGYEDNTMRPQNHITRAEVASLIYHLLSAIADTPAEIPAEGWVLYRGEEPLPPELRHSGSLVIGQKMPSKFSPENWSVSHLVLHTGSGTEADLTGVQADTLFFAPVSGSAKAGIRKVWLAGSSNYRGETDLLTVTGGTHKVTGRSGHVSTGSHVKLTMTGDAQDLTAGEHSLIHVDGSIPAVTLKDYASMVLGGDARDITMGYYTAMSVSGSASHVTAGDKSLISVKGDAGNVETGKNCTVTLNGNAGEITLRADTSLELGGTADKVTVDGLHINISGTGHIGTLAYKRKKYVCSVPCDELDGSDYLPYYDDYDDALNVVQTQRVPCTVEASTELYKNQNLTGYIRDLPKGATVYNEFHPSGDSFYASFQDESGKTVYGWLPRWSCTFPNKDFVNWDSELDYSQATKEGFVDQKGYSSKTDWLIWVNRYTQKVIIFQGHKGAWKLKKTFLCSSGANFCPTRAGTYELEGHIHPWYFEKYYVEHVTGFWGDHAFHTALKSYSGGYYDGRLGMPLSHGCIRMTDEGATFIEKELPLGTAVIVW